jgi:hypothetical protein
MSDGSLKIIEKLQDELEQARSENASLRQELRKIEWGGQDRWGIYCPSCGGYKDVHKHEPDCALSKLLGDE